MASAILLQLAVILFYYVGVKDKHSLATGVFCDHNFDSSTDRHQLNQTCLVYLSVVFDYLIIIIYYASWQQAAHT